MRNGGGPACLRLRVVLTEAELAAVAPGRRLDAALYARLRDAVAALYRDRLLPADLADPQMIEQCRATLDALADILAPQPGTTQIASP